MNFLWPQFLWLIAALPLLVLLYIWLMHRKKKMALRYASLSIVKEAMGARQSIKRHIPPLLFLFAMAAMLLAAARPVAVVTLPSNQQTIILAMDVSGSMRATDVLPSRLVAAQNAAKSFLGELPRHVKVGIVAFAGSAQVAQLPTTNREDLVTAIDRFQLQRATATGNAIVISLATLFPDAGISLESLQTGRDRQRGQPIDSERKEKKDFTPVAPGSYTSAAIIMLTDGQRTTGVDPLDAAKLAADRGNPCVHGGHRHGGRRDNRLRRLVDARAARRRNTEGNRAEDERRIFLRGHRAGFAQGLRDAQLQAHGGEEGNRDLRALRDGRRRAGPALGGLVAALVQPDSLTALPIARNATAEEDHAAIESTAGLAQRAHCALKSDRVGDDVGRGGDSPDRNVGSFIPDVLESDLPKTLQQSIALRRSFQIDPDLRCKNLVEQT